VGDVPSIRGGLKDRKVFILFIMCLLSSSLGLYFAGAYKIYGEEQLHDDYLLTAIGSAAAISNGLFRMLFGMI
jgi:hypothetical protein